MFKQFPKKHIAAVGAVSAVVTLALAFNPSTPVEAQHVSMSLNLDGDAITVAPMATPEVASQSESTTESPVENESTPVAEQPEQVADAVTADAEPQPDVVAQQEADDQDPAAPSEPVTQNEHGIDILQWQTFTVASGDTLSTLFHKAGYDDALMYQVLNGKGDVKSLADLYVGEQLSFGQDADHHFAGMKLERSRLKHMVVERDGDSFKARQVTLKPDIQTAYANGKIADSLFLSGQRAGLTDRQTMTLAGIFGWDIDFVNDIREGDRFSIVYEKRYLDGENIGNGRILAASFTNQGKEYKAVLYTDNEGVRQYYTPDGKSMRKAFLRTPVSFTRISSPFNLSRNHPILHHIRRHEGTDFAAPSGTPIKAAGNGRVVFAGRKGGYGNMVIIDHGHGITTRYGHMRRFARATHSGERVTQGEVIGYVGMTGLATGPHLHYEFRVNGTPKNSQTVNLPNADPIPRTELSQFKAQTGKLLAMLDGYEANHNLAMAKPAKAR